MADGASGAARGRAPSRAGAGPGLAAARAARHARSIENAAGEAARSPWVERAARFGYLVRGVLYVTMAALALQVARGGADREVDQQGALRVLASTPLGGGLLVVVAAGLAGYAAWGLVRALFDPLGKGTDPKGLAQRAAFLVSGVAHGALCVAAVRLLTGAGMEQGAGAGAGGPTAWLLSQPLGAWLVGLAGVWVVAAGLGELYLAYSTDFKKDLRREAMSEGEATLATNAGRAGMAARGVVFGLVGWFLVQAAVNADANRARGLDGALHALAGSPAGPGLLALAAAGLAAFGLYSALCARWMRVRAAGRTSGRA